MKFILLLASFLFFQLANAVDYQLDDRQYFWPRENWMTSDSDFPTNELARQFGPAKDDSNGHWGGLTNSAKASLRFPKSDYTNGEPIVATILIRNYSTNDTLSIGCKRAPFTPMEFVITDETGKLLERRHSTNGIPEPEYPIETFDRNVHEKPLEQWRFKQRIDFDLSKQGTYMVYGWDDVAQLDYSQKKATKFVLTTGKATIHIISPAMNKQ